MEGLEANIMLVYVGARNFDYIEDEQALINFRSASFVGPFVIEFETSKRKIGC